VQKERFLSGLLGRTRHSPQTVFGWAAPYTGGRVALEGLSHVNGGERCQRYTASVREEIGRTVSTPAEIDAEIHELCEALVVAGGRVLPRKQIPEIATINPAKKRI